MIVIDASVWVSFFVKQDVNHAGTQPWLTKILTNQVAIAAPILLLAEISGAMSWRLGRADLGKRIINHLLAIPSLRLVSTGHALGIQAARIAARHQLRGANALYVAVADQLSIPLVSWDKEQIQRVAGLITTYTPEQAKLR